MIDFVGVAWAWSMISELLAYPNGSDFPLAKGVQIIEVGLYIEIFIGKKFRQFCHTLALSLAKIYHMNYFVLF